MLLQLLVYRTLQVTKALTRDNVITLGAGEGRRNHFPTKVIRKLDLVSGRPPLTSSAVSSFFLSPQMHKKERPPRRPFFAIVLFAGDLMPATSQQLEGDLCRKLDETPGYG